MRRKSGWPVTSLDRDFDAEPMAEGERIQMIDDVVARLALEPINRGQIGKEIELEADFVAKSAEDVVRVIAADRDSFLAAGIFRAEILSAEALLQFFNQHRGTLRAI